jgi:protein-L-isoaspartate(D-aspartate) O-methyltransferase
MESPPSSRERRLRREAMARRIDAELGPFPPAYLRAIASVPRENFVRFEDEARAEVDAPLPLDDSGEATVSAPHAYLLSFRLVDLREGDRLLELGSGSGYGAALAAEIVGPRGTVVTLEIDPTLAERAQTLLSGRPNVRALCADAAGATPFFAECNKIVCAFAVDAIPRAWTDALAPGGVLVAPVGGFTQRLVRVTRDPSGALSTTQHGAVRYVRMRES